MKSRVLGVKDCEGSTGAGGGHKVSVCGEAADVGGGRVFCYVLAADYLDLSRAVEAGVVLGEGKGYDS